MGCRSSFIKSFKLPFDASDQEIAGDVVLTGWELIRASWEAIFKNTDSLEIETEIIKAEIDQSLAYIVVRETVLQSSRGRKLKAQSLATNLFQKMAQKWYLVSHHGSPIMR